jgi:hypothetical protein
MTAQIIPFNRDQLLLDLAALEPDCSQCLCSKVCDECPTGTEDESEESYQSRMDEWDARLKQDALMRGGWPLCRPWEGV